MKNIRKRLAISFSLGLLAFSLSSCTNMYDPEAEYDLMASSQAHSQSSSDSQSSTASSSASGFSTESPESSSRETSSSTSQSTETLDPSVSSAIESIMESWRHENSSESSSWESSSESVSPNHDFDFDHYDGYHAPSDWKKLYPYGSVGRLQGRIAVVSVFASEGDHVWDYEDAETYKAYSRCYFSLKTACEYLENECAGYGKDVEFLWDWMTYDHLYYTTTIDEDFSDILAGNFPISKAAWKFIDNNVNSEGLRNLYQADSVIYLFFLNSPEGNTQPSCTRDYYDGMPYPYEICYVQARNSMGLTIPAVMAHEMLHAFGAPDLYWTDTYSVFSLDYGITKEYTDAIKKDGLNDIMRITWNPETGQYEKDKILQHVTDITAYYTGLTDYSETVEKWGFEPSDFDH